MTLKTLEKFVSIVNDIVKATNYAATLNAFKNSWTSYRTIKNGQPTSSSGQQQIETTLKQAEGQKKILIDNAVKIKSAIDKVPDFDLKNNFDIFFGDSFVAFINSINQNTIEKEIIKLTDLVTKFQYIYQLSNTIKTLNIPITTVDLEKTNILEIKFSGSASISTLKEFTKQCEKWVQTFTLLGRIARESDTDLSVESVEKGSLILFISAATAIIVVACKAIDKIQDVLLKHIEIQKKTFELRKLQVDGFEDILKKLDEQAKINLSRESNQISESLLNDYGWLENDDLYNETKVATKKAVRSLIDFTNKGGSIRGYLPSPDEKEKQILGIVAKKNERIKELEKEINFLNSNSQTLLIGNLSNDEDEEEIK